VARRQPIPSRLRVTDQVAELLRKSHPQLKRKIRSALERIQHNPHAGKELRDELTGLRSYRVSQFRIIHRTSSRNAIDIIAIGPRRIIYEETYRLIKKNQQNPIG
jgi:mRNA-degrading endonuclease RelE of RelBE toxin-antitoxin system